MVTSSEVLHGPSPKHRRWRDLKIWRLAIGLAIAPALPILGVDMCAAALGALDGMLQLPFLWFLLIVLGSTGAWSLIAGFMYVLVIVRRRGILGRNECLLLGVGAAFLLPFALFAADALIDNRWSEGWRRWQILDPQINVLSETIGFAIQIGLFLALFGLPAGWAFWRIGVYPAKFSGAELAKVFD